MTAPGTGGNRGLSFDPSGNRSPAGDSRALALAIMVSEGKPARQRRRGSTVLRPMRNLRCESRRSHAADERGVGEIGLGGNHAGGG